MFKIGDYSKLSQVASRTLRYYDDIGLFRASFVDPETGYRYYEVDQLPRLNGILALRDLGFSLEQIDTLLDNAMTTEQMQSMLQEKREEISQHIEQEKVRLGQVEMRIQQIETWSQPPAYDVVVKELPPIQVLSQRDVMPTFSDVVTLFDGIYQHMGKYSARATGPTITIYHDRDFRESDIDMEAAVPISGKVPVQPPITLRALPACRVVSTIHQGSYFEIWQAWTAISQWLEVNPRQFAGPARDVYLRYGPNMLPSEYMTEIQLPIKEQNHE